MTDPGIMSSLFCLDLPAFITKFVVYNGRITVFAKPTTDNISFTFMTSFPLQHLPRLFLAFRILPFDPPRQFEQIGHSKQGAPGRDSNERINPNSICPTGWQ